MLRRGSGPHAEPQFRHPYRGLAPVLLFVLITGVYAPLLLAPGRFIWFDHYDLCQLEIPRLTFLARSIQQGHFPLWNPHVWTGVPVLGSAQPGPLYPLNLVFAAIPLKDGLIPPLALNLLYITVRFSGALFLYLFCRELKLGAVESALGSLLFSCGGFVGSLPWIDISNGAVWTPLIALFVLRIWHGKALLGDAAGLGLALGVSWLSGHHEIPLITSYVLLFTSASLIGIRSWKNRRFDWRLTGAFLLAAAIAAALSAPQTLPLYEFGRLSRRFVGLDHAIDWQTRVPYEIHQRLALSWKDLLSVVYPSATPEFHTTAFCGIAAISLAIYGFLCNKRHAVPLCLTFLSIFSLAYSLGNHTFLHPLLYRLLPMMDKARNTNRGLYLFSFAVAVLAAYGIRQLTAVNKRRLPAAIITVASLTALFVGLSGLLRPMPAVAANWVWHSTAAVGLLAMALLPIPWRWPWRTVAIAGAILLEISTVAELRIQAVRPGNVVCATDLMDRADLVNDLRQSLGTGRISMDYNAVLTSLGDLRGFDQVESFSAAVPERFLRLEFWTPRTRELLGVTRHIGRDAPGPNQHLTGEYLGGIKMLQNDALPRAWISHQVLRVADEKDLRARIAEPDFDLASTVLTLDPLPSLQARAGLESVTAVRPDSDTVQLTVRAASRGIVVLSDVFYPGWEARTDGRPVPIFEVYGALRGVVVDAGMHRVTMTYRPLSVRLGCLSCLVALIVSASLIWYDNRHAAQP